MIDMDTILGHWKALMKDMKERIRSTVYATKSRPNAVIAKLSVASFVSTNSS